MMMLACCDVKDDVVPLYLCLFISILLIFVLTMPSSTHHCRVFLVKDGTSAVRREADAPSFAKSASLSWDVLQP
jgi:hypothetical protein